MNHLKLTSVHTVQALSHNVEVREVLPVET